MSATTLELRSPIGFTESESRRLAANGLGQRGEFELNMGERLGNLASASPRTRQTGSWTFGAGRAADRPSVRWSIKERSDYAANKLFDLGGKVVLVTGGSRGIDSQMAEALGEMGCKLAISARKQHELDAASAALRRTNIEVLTIANDLGTATDAPPRARSARCSTIMGRSTSSSTMRAQCGAPRPSSTARKPGAR